MSRPSDAALPEEVPVIPFSAERDSAVMVLDLIFEHVCAEEA
ncbi:MAG: hypothetical protein ACLRVN_02320 [Butyricicoccus sp.]